MDDRFKLEAHYWRAFALLAIAGKRTIGDFWAELHRCSAGQFPSSQEVENILDEFYAELGRLLNSTLQSGRTDQVGSTPHERRQTSSP